MPGSSPAGITVTVVQGLVPQVVDLMIRVRLPSVTIYAVCPGGEGAVLKTVELKGFAGSNPVHGVLVFLRNTRRLLSQTIVLIFFENHR